jgi:hypothetical protein
MSYGKDLAERMARTFLQAALAVVAANIAGLTDVDTAKTLVVSAVAAGLSAVMSLVAGHVGDPSNASFARTQHDHEVPDDLVELHQLIELDREANRG